MKSNLENLQNQLNKMYKKYEKQKEMHLKSSDFNIFKAIGSISDEVNLHSKFIYSLLNDKLYGKQFLSLLLKYIDIKLQINDYIVKATVSKEKSVYSKYLNINRRLDLHISFETYKKEKYLILIENKIYASDQLKQMDDYVNYANKHCYDYYNKSIVYLTLDGHKPVEINKKNLEQITCISYEDDIINWINDCIKLVGLKETRLEQNLIQYKEVIIELTSRKENELIMSIEKLLLESPENIISANNLDQALINVKTDLQFKFWETLEINLEKQLSNLYKINIDKVEKNNKLGKYNPWYKKSIIKKSYKNARGDNFYGLLYPLDYIYDIGNIYLKVELESDKTIFFGLRKQVDDIKEFSKNYTSLINILENNKYENINNFWWIGRKKLIINNDDVINMNLNNKKLLDLLMHDDKLNILIDNCVNQILELVEIVDKFKS